MLTLDDTVRKILARPREAGTSEAAAARELVTAHLQGLGYTVVRQKFTFAPSSLRAFPVFGDGLGLLTLILLPLLARATVPTWAALAVWSVGLASTAILACGVGLGWVPFGDPLREDANLIGTRGAAQPRRWIVAHLDTKSQGHSMAGRLLAVWLVVLATAALSLCAGLRLRGPVAPWWLVPASGLALVAAFLARRGHLRGSSQGARDNGSGITAVLAAAEAAPAEGLGILITGAEEFGLVGARVYARLTPGLRDAEFINLDTIDQEGLLYLVSHDARGEQLARSLLPALSAVKVSLKRRRLPLGIFVDSAPLARAGAPAVTIGRLTWKTLRRIHTPADTPDDLSLDTALRVGRAIAQA